MILIAMSCSQYLVCSCGPKSSLSAFSCRQGIHLLESWIENPFADKLSDAIAFGHREVDFGMVEQNHADVPAIVLVHDTSCGEG